MRLALVARTMLAEVETMEQEYPCDKATWHLIIPNGAHLAIWPDEETARQLPANAYPELRDKAAEHIAMVADMRQKLRDVGIIPRKS